VHGGCYAVDAGVEGWLRADAGCPRPGTIKRGTIRDYVSGKMVAATPEELEAVQIMARRLVEDFGYPKEHLQTRPQWRVATSPSASKKYPVDIAVFSSEKHVPENLVMVVECKRRIRKDGQYGTSATASQTVTPVADTSPSRSSAGPASTPWSGSRGIWSC